MPLLICHELKEKETQTNCILSIFETFLVYSECYEENSIRQDEHLGRNGKW